MKNQDWKKKRDDLDDWPERIGIPTIQQTLVEVLFVESCLTTDSVRQRRAKMRLKLAHKYLKQALNHLKHT